MLATKLFLKEASERERPTAICRWLDRLSVPYVLSADGWPSVLEEILLAKLGVSSRPKLSKEPRLRLKNDG